MQQPLFGHISRSNSVHLSLHTLMADIFSAAVIQRDVLELAWVTRSSAPRESGSS